MEELSGVHPHREPVGEGKEELRAGGPLSLLWAVKAESSLRVETHGNWVYVPSELEAPTGRTQFGLASGSYII